MAINTHSLRSYSDYQRGVCISFEQAALNRKHPGYKKIVASNRYKAWLQAQPKHIQDMHYKSTTADEASYVLNKYKAYFSKTGVVSSTNKLIAGTLREGLGVEVNSGEVEFRKHTKKTFREKLQDEINNWLDF